MITQAGSSHHGAMPASPGMIPLTVTEIARLLSQPGPPGHAGHWLDWRRQAILAEIAKVRPELTAFFGCLYYAALRPAEAVALRADSCACYRSAGDS